MNLNGIVYPHLPTLISEPFGECIFFNSLLFLLYYPEFFELSIANITVLTLVSCDHVTSFRHYGKKARDLGPALLADVI